MEGDAPLNDSTMMLQYLDMLIKHGTFTRAAKELSISQPYLTQTIKKIETNLGKEIINREAKPLLLTEVGQLYYQYLTSIEIEQDHFFRKLSNMSYTDSKVISIGVLPTLGNFLLPKFLPDFSKKYPHIRIDIQERFPKINEDQALKENIDFFIGQNAETASPDLITKSSDIMSYVAIIPESSPLYLPEKKELSPNDLDIRDILRQPILLTSIGSVIRRQIDILLNLHNIIPDIILESSSIFTVTELARKGIGVTLAPQGIINMANDHFNLYPLDRDLISISYFIGYSNKKELTPEEADLVDFFINSISENFNHTKTN